MHPSATRREGTQARLALQSYAALERSFGGVDGAYSDADRPYAQAWPLSQALAASAAAAQLPGAPVPARAHVRATVRLLEHYRRGDAYDSSIRSPYGAGGDQFYDDNEWIGLDLVEVGTLLHDRHAVRAARRLFRFGVSGWDASPTDPCPGGVFWESSAANRDRNTVSTANLALLALELDAVAHDPGEVAWAQRAVDWVNLCLRATDGRLFDHIDLAGRVDRARWSYNQGAMIAAQALLAQATGDRSYLVRAESLAATTLRAEQAARWQGEPPAFVAIFFRDLRILDAVRPHPAFLAALAAYLEAHPARRGGGSGTTLLDQAADVQLRAQLAAA